MNKKPKKSKMKKSVTPHKPAKRKSSVQRPIRDDEYIEDREIEVDENLALHDDKEAKEKAYESKAFATVDRGRDGTSDDDDELPEADGRELDFKKTSRAESL